MPAATSVPKTGAPSRIAPDWSARDPPSSTVRSHQSSVPSRTRFEGLVQASGGEALARLRAAEAHHVPADEACVRGKQDAQRNLRARTVEQHRVLRQPFDERAGPHRQRGVGAGHASGRAVPLRRAGGRQLGMRALHRHRCRSPANRRQRCRPADARRPPGRRRHLRDRAASAPAAGRRAGEPRARCARADVRIAAPGARPNRPPPARRGRDSRRTRARPSAECSAPEAVIPCRSSAPAPARRAALGAARSSRPRRARHARAATRPAMPRAACARRWPHPRAPTSSAGGASTSSTNSPRSRFASAANHAGASASGMRSIVSNFFVISRATTSIRRSPSASTSCAAVSRTRCGAS